ncbi:MAG: hypothetical protein KUL88_04410 [Rhizobium sp.]|nr:hypothetical protein [Rhizobium sp.]
MSSFFLKRLADLLLGGPARPAPPAAAPKPLPEILFVPVIFANGRDDDMEGVKAFLEHRPVMLAGRLIAPENNTARLEGLHLRFSCGQLVLMHDRCVVQVVGFPMGRTIMVHVPPQSQRSIYRCEMTMNAPVQP